MTTTKAITMPPKVAAFADLLRSGAFTQAELAKKTGYSPKSISNLISTVHNRPGLVTKDGRGIPGFRVTRDEKTGLRKYQIGEVAARKPRAKKAKEVTAEAPAPEVTAETTAPEATTTE